MSQIQKSAAVGERWIVRAGLMLAAVLLAAGVALSLFHDDTDAYVPLIIGFGVLVALPVTNVVIILMGELRRRDWRFAAVTAAVLVILIFNFLRLKR